MARYIDADKLYDAVEGVYKYAKGGERLAAKLFLSIIHDVPTADVVEVVRCKDCIFSQELERKRPPYKYYNQNCILCVCEDVVGDEAMLYLNNHFCSCGKRKDGVGE